ncbi:MAG: hypothetical protein DYG92_13165 [Leptolyngbya sp. PLA1]|nr:hypothetical protein [Leptolyngbya sp. PLA1]
MILRSLRATLRFLPHAMSLVAAVGWGISVGMGDRALWSQFVAYVPLAVWVCLACAGALCSWFVPRRHPCRPEAARPRRRPSLHLVLALMLLAHQALDWRLLSIITATPAPFDRPVRVLSWNPAWERLAGFDERVVEQRPDIFVATTPHYTADFGALRSKLSDTTFAFRSPTFAVVSVFPVIRSGWVSLDTPPPAFRPSWIPKGAVSSSGGEAAFVEIDTTSRLGRPTVIWCVDLPSDPFTHRREVVRQALASIHTFRGPVQHRKPDGTDNPGEPAPFPDPDMIVGDFNTPRGSGALREWGSAMRNAYDDAGIGPAGTFPARWGILHIDHQLLGPHVRAVGYDVIDLGGGRHAAVLTRIAPAR